MERVQKVLANCEQGLSNTEKAQARRNIDAQATLTAGRNITISESNVISAADAQQVQANWNETDPTADSYIQNKPNVPSIIKSTTTLPPVDTNINTLQFLNNGRVLGDSSQLGLIAPTGGQTDAGKVLTLHYSGSPGVTTAQWDELPSGVEIATATHGQAGTIEEPVQKLVIDEDFGALQADGRTVGLVAPVPLSSDSGKFVAVNGDLLEYVDAPKGAFIGYWSGYSTGHNNTPHSEYLAAHNEGKAVFCKQTVSGGDIIYRLDNIDTSNAFFSRTLGAVSNGSYGQVSNSCLAVHNDNTYTLYQNALQSALTAGSYISIGAGANNTTVVSNTMHLDTAGLMISYNTLANAGVTTHSFGPWRIQITKKAMSTWDTVSSTSPSVLVQVAHSDYIGGTITNGRIQHMPYYPWKDGTITNVFSGHLQWGFNGSYSQGGSYTGFPIYLVSPLDSDGVAKACPNGIQGVQLTYNCGINAPDWLELNVEPMYTNNNTDINSNAARLILRVKYFYA